MTREVSRVRPAVISIDTGTKLDDYRGFRHIVRNVYTYKLDPVKLGKLVSSSQDLYDELNAEITAFVAFLERE